MDYIQIFPVFPLISFLLRDPIQGTLLHFFSFLFSLLQSAFGSFFFFFFVSLPSDLLIDMFCRMFINLDLYIWGRIPQNWYALLFLSYSGEYFINVLLLVNYSCLIWQFLWCFSNVKLLFFLFILHSFAVSHSKDGTQVFLITGRFFSIWATRDSLVAKGRRIKLYF